MFKRISLAFMMTLGSVGAYAATPAVPAVPAVKAPAAPAALKVAAPAAKNEPTVAELERANKACELNTDNTATYKLPNGDEVKFVPAKIGDLNDAERAKGCILGKLVAPRKTPGGLDADTYRAYLCKELGEWCVYWIKDTKVVAKATCNHSANDNQHEPAFQDNNKMIRYWEVKFSF